MYSIQYPQTNQSHYNIPCFLLSRYSHNQYDRGLSELSNIKLQQISPIPKLILRLILSLRGLDLLSELYFNLNSDTYSSLA